MTARTLVGRSAWSPAAVESHIGAGGGIDAIPGDFTLELDGGLFSSAVAAEPYYYTIADGVLVHGKCVFDLVKAVGYNWQWNRRAIQCMALLGHTVGHDTLHPKVYRVPPATSINKVGETDRNPYWDGVFRNSSTVDEVVRAFHRSFADLEAKKPLVSLSAGFDSRAILATTLSQGIEPSVITMGYPESTDRVVASAICRSLGLTQHVVEIDAARYLDDAMSISHLTSGTKTAGNWHTYIYGRAAAAIGHDLHLVGANGEFARSWYLDYGQPARLADILPAGTFAYFSARLAKRAKLFSSLACVDTDAQAIQRLAFYLSQLSGPGGRSLNRLDRFYATQRVRHFIGNGMALYNDTTPTVSPFLDARFIRSAAGLDRRLKLGSRWHRLLIKDAYPELLKFPSEGNPSMATSPDRHYWRKTETVSGYSPFATVIGDPSVAELVINSELLDGLADRSERETIVARGEQPAMEMLLTLHYAAQHAASAF